MMMSIMARHKCLGISFIILNVVIFLASLTLMFALIWFAWNNPDNEGVYAVITTTNVNGDIIKRHPVMISNEMLESGTDYRDTSDVHSTFLTWFIWGSINMLVALATYIVMTLLRNPIVLLIASLLRCYCCCSGLIWFIAGLCWRF